MNLGSILYCEDEDDRRVVCEDPSSLDLSGPAARSTSVSVDVDGGLEHVVGSDVEIVP